ncbi:MAG: Lipoprotein-releasing system ATP-binding protein LolD [Paracidovorax wautersii]|uniref:Lipoprotein-releasing system ATP-binding protein LolD n=1 Tax=Paracidovorax wautersii TaxID=1177982 RepID=A0A7V8JPK9_9BURK|nr:MAG: Lipoprotein-releasing system ATP-binding protein LolD [Paracidovorax wautersii]
MNTSAHAPVLQARGLTKHYGDRPVFTHIELTLHAGEFLAVLGPSGSGKSTLLNCLAGLDTWQAGDITLAGQSLATLGDDARALLRRHALGFVFQAFHVLPHLSVAQNLAVPLLLLGEKPESPHRRWEADSRIAAMLDAVGLHGYAARMPAELSGGQLQRVAIARALIHRPRVLLADEPTGNLDTQTADRVMALLREQTRLHGTALVLVTHAEAAAASADQVLRMG